MPIVSNLKINNTNYTFKDGEARATLASHQTDITNLRAKDTALEGKINTAEGKITDLEAKATKVVGNTPITGSEPTISSIEIGGTKYKMPEGGGGGGEPADYLKDASVSGNTLTIHDKNNNAVTYTPTIPEVPSQYVKDVSFDDRTDELVFKNQNDTEFLRYSAPEAPQLYQHNVYITFKATPATDTNEYEITVHFAVINRDATLVTKDNIREVLGQVGKITQYPASVISRAVNNVWYMGNNINVYQSDTVSPTKFYVSTYKMVNGAPYGGTMTTAIAADTNITYCRDERIAI